MAASVLIEPWPNAIKESSVIASLENVSKKFGRQIALDSLVLSDRNARITLGSLVYTHRPERFCIFQ